MTFTSLRTESIVKVPSIVIIVETATVLAVSLLVTIELKAYTVLLKYTESMNEMGENPAIVLTFNRFPISALPVEILYVLIDPKFAFKIPVILPMVKEPVEIAFVLNELIAP